RKPYHLFLGEAQRARMIELIAQLPLVDLLGDAHPCGAVDQRKRRLNVAIEAPDHLEHHQLVEIGVEQAADARVELEGEVVDPLADVGRDSHEGLRRRRGRIARDGLSYLRKPILCIAAREGCRWVSLKSIIGLAEGPARRLNLSYIILQPERM